MTGSTRRTADDRRTEVTAAAAELFAHDGYAGTSTDAVARAAGVSQPYVIRLFGGKRGLFVAVIAAAFDELSEVLIGLPRRPAPAAREDVLRDVIDAVGERRDLVLVLLQAVAAAAGDEAIREALQDRIRAAHKTVWAAAGGDTDRVRVFFGQLALLGTVTAVDVPELLGPDW